MTERISHNIIGLLFLVLATYASYSGESFQWGIGILLANMWIISASFKE